MEDPAVTEVAGLLHGPGDGDPYRKWSGSHWRLVELADLAGDGAHVPAHPLKPMFDAEYEWLLGPKHTAAIAVVDGITRRCASQEGNALYAASVLGREDDSRTRALAERLLSWQWTDGGWNCDTRHGVARSSFHESITPALGLVAFGKATGDTRSLDAANRTAELILRSRVIFSRSTPDIPVHPSWAVPHYPAYWHYDVLQGLRLLYQLGLLDDPRAAAAVEILAQARRANGFAGASWTSKRQRPAIDRGTGTSNRMRNQLATKILLAAGE